ncbi:MAG: nitrate- and nitrite sensing domain-containing protein [Magnetospirillum gryphiswaldense]|nr:nitrate- and nitrite sensing domain-containing protein [Magnetospirillum gryphiswaldense]
MQGFVSAAALGGFAVPAAALIVAAPPLFLDARRLGKTSAQTLERIGLIIAAGRLIHELQRERGLSVGFLSKPEGDGTALASQRQHTDTAQNAFGHLFSRQPADPVNDAVTQALNGLATHRHSVDSRKLTPPQAALGYSGRIGTLLDLIALGVKSSARGRLARLGTAYLNLISAKEAAGQERAHLTGILSAPGIEAAARRRAHDLREQQDMLLKLFAEGAGGELARFSRATLADSERVVTSLRYGALSEDISVHRPTAPMWFEAATRRIDALKEVEMRLEETMNHAALAVQGRSRRNLRWLLAAVLGSAGLLGGIATAAAGVW